ncbi:hypothetical protein CVT24_001095 [Panaeolus cyanescens]|uniref:Major facilitator superfamily (MFS) profile domain-containing protein n=1 Tax=Panaeolus cyanescens TaxID=181874 RepID=A0A409YTJ2_9AGAR|nr:hypothetical protein CVT24_001095 [Panaeolus cyanescens]
MDEPTRYKKDSMKYARIPYMLIFRSVTGGTEDLTVIFGWNVVINLFYIPGTMIGAFVVDYLGPKWTMITGLLAQAIVGFIMSGLYAKLTQHIAAFALAWQLRLYMASSSVLESSASPGNNTIILASKTSPTAIRGQFYGIAAAVGKVGAFVGTWAFPPMIKAFGGDQTERGNTGPFWVGSGLAILSAMVTFLLTPLDEEGMAREDQKILNVLSRIQFREYLEANGYDTAAMGLRGPESDSERASVDVDEKDEKEST